MATFTPTTKNSSTWATISKPSGTAIPAGSVIGPGFFMFLTYSTTTGATSWTPINKS